MDLWTALTTLLRRWYVVVPALALTALLALRVADAVEPTYTADAAVLIVQTSPGENPYASFSTSITITARALAEAARGDAFRAGVRERGGRGSYTVDVEQDTPMLRVRTQSGRADDAVFLLRTVVDGVNTELRERQDAANIKNDVLLTPDVLDMPSSADEQAGQRTRALIGVLGLGLAGSLAAAFVVESLVVGRRESLHLAEEPADRSTSRVA